MPDRAWSRWVKRGLVAIVAASVLIAAGNLAVMASTRGQLAAGVESAPARPVVIVLGNLVLPGGQPGGELSERLETAYALYHSGRAPRIFVSGMARPGYDEPQAMAAWLQARGVPAADIVMDGGGHRTAATMANAAALGIKSALVSTQQYHLPRALYLARHAGIDAVGVPARLARRAWLWRAQNYVREVLARAEVLVEVALRGVRA